MLQYLQASFALRSSVVLTGVLAACSSGTATEPMAGAPAAGAPAAGAPVASAGAGGTTPGAGGASPAGSGGTASGAGGAQVAAAGTSGAVGGAAGTSANEAGSGATAGNGSAGTGSGTCTFDVTSQTADQAGDGGIPTVGIVKWSVDRPSLASAQVVFGLDGAAQTMSAPVDVTKGPSFRTLLLGMKAAKTYSFHVEVNDGTTACTSPSYTVKTGALPSGTPSVTRTAGPAAASQAKGFIVTSSGIGSFGGGMGGGMSGGMMGGASYAFILDADGEVVWVAPAPASCSRAKMSYDGQFMWMVEVNVDNSTKDGGEVRRVSMDGLTTTMNVPGLANCHHDLTVLPDGKVACASWVQQSGDQPSDLIEGDAEGNVTKVVTLDSNIYIGGQGMGGGNSYHANAIHYHPSDDSYTVGDRNPNLFVKVSRQGQVLWQFGGSCTGAPAPQCIAGDWSVNHGHDLLPDGTFLLFNNGQGSQSAALFYRLTETGTFAAEKVGSYSPGVSSAVLGDVQRLPSGNTLIAFSTSTEIHEIDATGALVQTLKGPGGYLEWRETLYGPPPRL